MRVTAQLQRKIKPCRLGVSLGAVREEHHKRILRSLSSRSSEVMRLEVVRVVHSGDPQGIFSAPYFGSLVQEDRESIPLEVQHHFKWIVVSKDAPAILSQRFPELCHRARRSIIVALHAISVVSSEHGRVVRGFID